MDEVSLLLRQRDRPQVSWAGRKQLCGMVFATVLVEHAVETRSVQATAGFDAVGVVPFEAAVERVVVKGLGVLFGEELLVQAVWAVAD